MKHGCTAIRNPAVFRWTSPPRPDLTQSNRCVILYPVTLKTGVRENSKMIYGRFGNPLTIVRMGTLDDVKTLDQRKPDKQDRAVVEAGGYVVVREEGGKERLYHQAYMRADGGAREIGEALEALGTVAAP